MNALVPIPLVCGVLWWTLFSGCATASGGRPPGPEQTAQAGASTEVNAPPASASETPAQRVARILAETPLIDGHNDIAIQYFLRVENRLGELDLAADLSGFEDPIHTDISRLRRGMVGGQFWSAYIRIDEYGGSPANVSRILQQIDLIHRMVHRYSDTFEMAFTAADIRRIHASGKIASLIGVEGGHAINNSLAVLRQLYALGTRYMTITHNKGLYWADSATDEHRHGGLTAFGKDVIREMNRLGMLVDLSHVSVDTMRDAMAASRAPVIFSHSSAYALVPHARNVPDEVLRQVAETGAVVMVTFFPAYVSEERRQYQIALRAETERLVAAHGEEGAAAHIAAWQKANPAPRATLSQVADHIDHVRQVAGIDHVGIGGDYDGMPPGPIGLEDVSGYPGLFVELLSRGYSDDDIAKIAGGNVLRVMTEVEAVAEAMKDTPPLETQMDMVPDMAPDVDADADAAQSATGSRQ